MIEHGNYSNSIDAGKQDGKVKKTVSQSSLKVSDISSEVISFFLLFCFVY